MSALRRLAKSGRFHARRLRVRALAFPRALPWLRHALHLPCNAPCDPSTAAVPGVRLARLDAPTTFVRPLPLLPFDPGAAPYFAARAIEQDNASFVAELTDGALWGHPSGAVFTADDRFVPSLTHDPCGPALHPVWARSRLPRPQFWPGRTLYLVTPEAADNFHHWLIDLLPRLGLVQRAGHDLASFDRVVLNHAHRPYQLATLRQLGIAPERLVTVDASVHARCATLVVPSLKHHNQCAPAADVAFLRRTFLPKSGRLAPRRRIFLSRADARYRRLVNEAELHPLLAAHGFELVSPAALSVPEQARLFAESEIVAGPAGAAFANLVFCSPPARVLEIAPPQWLATYHWMLSARRGLPHTIVLAEGDVMQGLPDMTARSLDLRVDPEKFAAALAPLLAPPVSALASHAS